MVCTSKPQPMSDRVVDVLRHLDGVAPRAEVMRRIAPALGVRRTRLAVGLAIVSGRVALDAEDVMRLAVHATEKAPDHG